MLHIALYEPEIPPNTGNIIRLCANTGATLHLIAPLGFELDDRRLRRAGLDYHEYAAVTVHDSLQAFSESVQPGRLFACSTKASRCYADVIYQDNDALLFGPESRGLPAAILAATQDDRRIRIPMREGSRSLNLSNAAAIILYEAWRQRGFAIL